MMPPQLADEASKDTSTAGSMRVLVSTLPTIRGLVILGEDPESRV